MKLILNKTSLRESSQTQSNPAFVNLVSLPCFVFFFCFCLFSRMNFNGSFKKKFPCLSSLTIIVVIKIPFIVN